MIWTAILTITVLALLAGIVLSFVARRLPANSGLLADEINKQLPQTQCAQCNYPGCRPYAEAIANGVAEINLCPPGGDDLIARLANLLGRDPLPLDASLEPASAPGVAFIIENLCIGCTYCIDACPVDAIVGARNQMHTIIAAECTGCELCLPPCPVDCIEMRARP